MKYIIRRLVAVVLLSVLTIGTLQAKRVQVNKIYMFGFAASFTDTIVHFTNVQEIDTVWIESKGHFLLGRDLYSHQLRNYLNEKQMPGRTCVVFYDTKRKKLEKQFLKMKRLYSQPKDGKNRKRDESHFDVRFLDDGEFKFKNAKISFGDE